MESNKRMKNGLLGYYFPPVPRGPRSPRGWTEGWKQNRKLRKDQGLVFDFVSTVAGELLQNESERIVSEINHKSAVDMGKNVENFSYASVQDKSEQAAAVDLCHNHQCNAFAVINTKEAAHTVSGSSRMVGNAYSCTSGACDLGMMGKGLRCTDFTKNKDAVQTNNRKQDFETSSSSESTMLHSLSHSCDYWQHPSLTNVHSRLNVSETSLLEYTLTENMFEDGAGYKSTGSVAMKIHVNNLPPGTTGTGDDEIMAFDAFRPDFNRVCHSIIDNKAPVNVDNMPCDSSIDERKTRLLRVRDDDENFSDISDSKTPPNRPSKFLSVKGAKFGNEFHSKYYKHTTTRKRTYSNVAIPTEGVTKSDSLIYGSSWDRENMASSSFLLERNLDDMKDVNGTISPSSVPDIRAIEDDDSCGCPNLNNDDNINVQGNVKLCIKSFAFQELAVDIPQAASIARLKKAATDAVMKFLMDGFHVQVLLNGTELRNDNATLVGLLGGGSENGKHKTATEFILEPTLIQRHLNTSCLRIPSADDNASTGNHEDNMSDEISKCEVSTMDSNLQLMSYGRGPIMHSAGNQNSHGEGIMPSTATITTDNKQISKKSEFSKRRLRRPFTVAEVEALVQAVEKLGTGRWREIKLHSFDQAEHRTYVDLKDKWKTLVHTATIEPHQRRGEPVPIDLLERVTRAHNYWTERQKFECNE